MTQGFKLRWVRSSVQAYKELIEYHVTEAYSGLGLDRVQYSVRWLWSDEKEKFTVRINPISLIFYMLVRMDLCAHNHSQIPDAVCACDRRFTQFVIKTMLVCFSTQGNYSGFVDV
jgi:hypothetical protein